MSKPVANNCDNWAEFGKFIATILSAVTLAFILYLLLFLPYERHTKVINQLERMDYKIDVLENRIYNIPK